MDEWKVVFYETATGERPVQDYLDNAPSREAARITRSLRLLEQFGLSLGDPYIKHVEGKIWELRVRGQHLAHRVLYFTASGRQLVLLHAFAKKTDKTPRQDVNIAESRRADFESRLESRRAP